MRDRARPRVMERLGRQPGPEVLVVGAGINGAAVFRDLALQGVAAVLVDKADIAAGASAAPSRMVHGGLRYLETAEIALVRQSTYERNLLLRNARHLVAPLRTVVPLYSRWGGTIGALRKLARRPSASGRRGAVLVRIGLTLYDLIGRRARMLPSHRMLSREAVLAMMPGLTGEVTAAAEYWDAWITHPERLNVELVADALAAMPDSEVLTYAAVEAIEGGAVRVRDTLEGGVLSLRPKLLVNAAGAWIDQVNAPLGINQRLIGGTKGSHLVLDHPALHDRLGDAMLWFEAADGRTCIVFPFLGHVLLGSTDIRTDDPDSVRCEEAEIDYLFAVLGEVFPGLDLRRDQIVFRYSGVRPLPHVRAGSTALIPRSHSLVVHEPTADRPFPVLSLVGGKWTTFRGFAEEAVDAILPRLGRAGRKVDTALRPIGGGDAFPATQAARLAWVRRAAKESGLPEGRIATLLDRYGTRARLVAAAIARGPDAPLATLPDYSTGELAWIAREELVVHLADVLLRRTLIAIRGDADSAVVAELAEVVGAALGWPATRRQDERAEALRILADRHGILASADGGDRASSAMRAA